MWHHSHVVISQKLSSQDSSMGWHIVMVKQPCFVPLLIRSLPLHILPFDVECTINCLTRRNKFFLIKETNQHWLDIASHLPCLVRLRWPRTFPLNRLSFGFWVVGLNPGFVTRNDIQKKAGVINSIFFKVQANVKSLLFFVDTQESGHELWCDTSHLQIVCQNFMTSSH